MIFTNICALALIVIIGMLHSSLIAGPSELGNKFKKVVIVNGLELTAIAKTYGHGNYSVHLGIGNAGSDTFGVVKNVDNTNARVDDKAMLRFEYQLFCGDEYSDEQDEILCKPSVVELGTVILMPEERTHLSINRIVFSNSKAIPEAIKVVYRVDPRLASFYPDTWTGEVEFWLSIPPDARQVQN